MGTEGRMGNYELNRISIIGNVDTESGRLRGKTTKEGCYVVSYKMGDYWRRRLSGV
jgi:5-hydroxyisourate hydrolase-like protein (transthyretin family)